MWDEVRSVSVYPYRRVAPSRVRLAIVARGVDRLEGNEHAASGTADAEWPERRLEKLKAAPKYWGWVCENISLQLQCSRTRRCRCVLKLEVRPRLPRGYGLPVSRTFVPGNDDPPSSAVHSYAMLTASVARLRLLLQLRDDSSAALWPCDHGGTWKRKG